MIRAELETSNSAKEEARSVESSLPVTDEPFFDGSLEQSHIIECREDVFCCELNPSKNRVAVGTGNGIVKIYRMEDGKNLYQLVDVEVRRSYLPVCSVSWIGDDKILVGYAAGYVKIWNISNQECIQTIDENRTILQTCVTPDKDAFIVSGKDTAINIYSLPIGCKTQTCQASPSLVKMDGHRTSVYGLKHHPTDIWNFISGGWDDTIQFWDRREERAVRRLFGPHICGQSIDINPRNNTILTGSWRIKNGLEIWDYRNGEKIKDIPDERDSYCRYYAAQFLGPDNIMAGGNNRNLFRVVNKNAGVDVGLVSKLPGGVMCCDKGQIQQSGETFDVVACFGYSTKLQCVDIKDVDRKASVLN